MMQRKIVKIEEIKLNRANPRVIKDENYHKLLNSLLIFPKMLRVRPIVVDKSMVVLGGNMRLKALQEIVTFSQQELKGRLCGINEFVLKDIQEQEELILQWQTIIDNKEIDVCIANDFTDSEASSFIIKDNSSFGQWDYELLENWDKDLLKESCVNIDVFNNYDFLPPIEEEKEAPILKKEDTIEIIVEIPISLQEKEKEIRERILLAVSEYDVAVK